MIEYERIPMTNERGDVFHVARVPRVERRFRSGLHRTDVMGDRLGTWRTEFAAFMDGRLPAARLVADVVSADRAVEAHEIRRTVSDAVAAGHAVKLAPKPHGGSWTATVVRTDAIVETLDAAALVADVEAWITAAGLWDDRRAEEVAAVRDDLQDGARYSDFMDDLDVVPGADDLYVAITRGLAVGDHPAVTVAFWLHQQTRDAWWWHRPQETPAEPGSPTT